MKRIMIILACTIVGLMIVVVFYGVRSGATYTARAYIEVLRPVEVGAEQSGIAQANMADCCARSESIACLMKTQGLLEDLVDRDRIRALKWFAGFGAVQPGTRIRGAIADLQNNLRGKPIANTNLIEVSMTCSDAAEAAIIVNEMVEMFVARQKSSKRKEVAARLKSYQEEFMRIQSELNLADMSLKQIRETCGIYGLDRRSFPHPITTRVNRLILENDKLSLEVAQAKGHLQECLNGNKGSGSEQAGNEPENDCQQARSELAALNNKLEEVSKLLAEATGQKRELDQARVQYQKQVRLRDDLAGSRENMRREIGRLRYMYENPASGGIRCVGLASMPLRRD